jgi:hypothetical protein
LLNNKNLIGKRDIVFVNNTVSLLFLTIAAANNAARIEAKTPQVGGTTTEEL